MMAERQRREANFTKARSREVQMLRRNFELLRGCEAIPADESGSSTTDIYPSDGQRPESDGLRRERVYYAAAQALHRAEAFAAETRREAAAERSTVEDQHRSEEAGVKWLGGDQDGEYGSVLLCDGRGGEWR